MDIKDRNIGAEARAVEEGHHAWYVEATDDNSTHYRVVSDTFRGKVYEVRVEHSGNALLKLSCKPVGEQAYKDDHLHLAGVPGALGCKHCALVARRLEREGRARPATKGETVLWAGFDIPLADGAWFRTDIAPLTNTPEDPFEGLPQF